MAHPALGLCLRLTCACAWLRLVSAALGPFCAWPALALGLRLRLAALALGCAWPSLRLAVLVLRCACAPLCSAIIGLTGGSSSQEMQRFPYFSRSHAEAQDRLRRATKPQIEGADPVQGRGIQSNQYSKESEKRTGPGPRIDRFAPLSFLFRFRGRPSSCPVSQNPILSSHRLGHFWTRKSTETQCFKAFLMVSAHFSWPTGVAAGRLAVRLEASASRSVLLFRFLRQFFI